jgi:type VI secretion system protein ImpG
MSDSVNGLIEQERQALRPLLRQFAQNHPDSVVVLLADGSTACRDPFAQMLLDAQAHCLGHVRFRFQTAFAHALDDLVHTFLPHLATPAPSLAVAQFQPPARLAAGLPLPRHSLLRPGREREPESDRLFFRTCREAILWPLKVATTEVLDGPGLLPPAAPAVRAWRLVLRAANLPEGTTLASLAGLDAVRLFLDGPTRDASLLWEALLAHGGTVWVRPEAGGTWDRAELRRVGFRPDEELLAHPARAFAGHRLLAEYFLFPHKHLFLDLCGLGAARARCDRGGLEIWMPLGEGAPAFDPRRVSPRLNCVPVANQLAKQVIVRLDPTKQEQPAVPADDPRLLVASIERVILREGERATSCPPLYGARHVPAGETPPPFWYARRVARDGDVLPALHLTLAHPHGDFWPAEGSWLDLQVTCVSRELPDPLMLQAVNWSDARTGALSARFLTPPTRPRWPEPPTRPHPLLPVQHLLHLNALGQHEPRDAAGIFREALQACAFPETAGRQLACLQEVQVRPWRDAPPPGWGQEVRLDVNDDRLPEDTGLYLLGSVLHRYLELAAPLNTATRLTVQAQGRSYRWLPSNDC